MDNFFKLKKENIDTIKKILEWAYKNSLKTLIHVIKVNEDTLRRKASNKSFEEVISYLDKRSMGFFVIIQRNQESFGRLFLEGYNKDSYIEIGIRSLYETKDIYDPNEYFIFCYLDADKMDELKKEWDIIPLK